MFRTAIAHLLVLAFVLPARADAPAASSAPPASPAPRAELPTGTGPISIPPTVSPPVNVPTITFLEAVRRAETDNPTVRLADAEVHRARALVEQTRAGSLPTLYGNLIYTHLDANRTSTVGGMTTVLSAQNQVQANAILTVPLVSTHNWAQWSHADENVGVTRLAANEARREIAISTARAYVSLTTQHRIVETFQRSVSNDLAHYEYTHTRFAAGAGTRLDEVRAAEQLAADTVQVAAQLSLMAREQEALGVLVGSDTPLDSTEDVPMANLPTEQQALRDSEQRRGDVQLDTSRLVAARHAVRDNWTDYMPTLLGVFEPIYQNPPTLTQPLTGWQAELILSVPFYDGGLRYGQAHERDQLTAEARVNLEGLLRQARSDVRSAVVEILRADEAGSAALEAARLADMQLTLAAMSYRQGASTDIEVIDAERVSRDAHAALNIADDAIRQARLDLLIASGRFP